MANMARKTGELEKGDRVEVRQRGSRSGWTSGVIKELAGRGAFVLREDGHSSFSYYSEIRHAELPQAKPLTASLGQLTSLRAVSREFIEPSASTPAPVSPPPAKSEVTTMVESKYKRTRVEHTPTPIGELVRRLRLENKLDQKQMARRCKSHPSTISHIELGDELPSDDMLLHLAESFGQGLDDLLALRDGVRPVPKEQQADPVPMAIEPEPKPAPAPEPSRARAPSEASELPTMGLPQFLGAIAKVFPLPPPGPDRAEWKQHVFQLFELYERTGR